MDDDDVDVDNNDYEALFDSREEDKNNKVGANNSNDTNNQEDGNHDDDDYVEDENNDEDEEEEEEVEVVGTTSFNPVDELLSPNLAAFFANNENTQLMWLSG